MREPEAGPAGRPAGVRLPIEAFAAGRTARPSGRRSGDDGFILLNVLVVLALAATVTYAMMTVADIAIARTQVFGMGSEGLALVQGAEQSAVAALRRDMVAAPETDHSGEAWSRVSQAAVAIPGGSFEVRIEDAQDRYNLNNPKFSGSEGNEVLQAISDAAELPADTVTRIVNSLMAQGPFDGMVAVRQRIGLTPDQARRLGELATVLPAHTEVNLNAAPAALIRILFNDPTRVVALVQQRDRAGFLTQRDLDVAGLELPAGTGFRSTFFRVVTNVRVGDTARSVGSLLQRRIGLRGAEVVVIGRRNLAGMPDDGADARTESASAEQSHTPEARLGVFAEAMGQ